MKKTKNSGVNPKLSAWQQEKRDASPKRKERGSKQKIEGNYTSQNHKSIFEIIN